METKQDKEYKKIKEELNKKFEKILEKNIDETRLTNEFLEQTLQIA